MDHDQYDEACESAAESQGITELVSALSANGIPAAVWQSGGFIMCADIDMGDGWRITAISENACLYFGEREEEVRVVAISPTNNPAEIAAQIVAYVREWRGGLSAMRSTRKRAESLRDAVPNDYGGEDSAGFVYAGGLWIADANGKHSVSVANDGIVGTLAQCESYLYGWCLAPKTL